MRDGTGRPNGLVLETVAASVSLSRFLSAGGPRQFLDPAANGHRSGAVDPEYRSVVHVGVGPEEALHVSRGRTDAHSRRCAKSRDDDSRVGFSDVSGADPIAIVAETDLHRVSPDDVLHFRNGQQLLAHLMEDSEGNHQLRTAYLPHKFAIITDGSAVIAAWFRGHLADSGLTTRLGAEAVGMLLADYAQDQGLAGLVAVSSWPSDWTLAVPIGLEVLLFLAARRRGDRLPESPAVASDNL